MAFGKYLNLERYWEIWRKDLSKNQRWILLSLLNYEGFDGGEIYPAVSRIAYDTGYSENAVSEILKSLEKDGVLIRIGKTHFGVIVYRLDLTVLPEKKAYVSKAQKKRLENKTNDENKNYEDEISY